MGLSPGRWNLNSAGSLNSSNNRSATGFSSFSFPDGIYKNNNSSNSSVCNNNDKYINNNLTVVGKKLKVYTHLNDELHTDIMGLHQDMDYINGKSAEPSPISASISALISPFVNDNNVFFPENYDQINQNNQNNQNDDNSN